MRICLIDNRSAGVLVPEAAGYVGELGPALAEDQRVTILTIEPGLRRLPGTTARVRRSLSQNQPEIVHLNNLTGLTLAGIMLAIGSDIEPFRPTIVLGLHDDRLLRRALAFHRWMTRSIKLVISPSSKLLDRHLAQDFFPGAVQEVIPYGMPYHAARLADAYRRLLIARRSGDLRDHAA
ncbi:MAG: hypothetical protein E6I88_12025 [Chloroflexi bacterium]|nr:MAG: hypothetical protein E6I88_12025 [Chloroflexota bacterium]TME45973.1 MAG: hypothetical protein E6I56_08280 [Chloroflexota bacterium]